MVKLQARINPETKMLDLSDGRSLPISAQFKAELFPETTEERLQGEEISKLRKRTPSAFGEALFKIGEGSSFLRGAKDVTNYISSLGEAIGAKKGQENLPYWERQEQNYQAKRKANELLSQEISERSPTASFLGTAGGVGLDLAGLRGVGGAVALPVMGAAGKGTDVIRDPIESIKDIGRDAAMGFVGDRIFGGLSKIAGRRGAIRQHGADVASVAEQNVKGEARNLFQQQQVAQNNKLATDIYQKELENRKTQIEALKHQRALAVHQRDVQLNNIANQKTADAQAQALQDRQYKQLKEAWEKDIQRIDAEYKTAEKEYEQALKELPKRQAEAQAIYSEEVLSNAKKIERVMAKEDRIYGDQINTKKFFDDVVNVGEHAGSAEAREAQRVLTTLFPENAIMDANDLVKRYHSLEKQISKSNPGKASILLDFKKHLGNILPGVLESNIAYRQIIPSLKKDLIKSASLYAKEAGLPARSIPHLEANINQSIRSISPQQFIEKYSDGTLKQEITNNIFTQDLFPIIKESDVIRNPKARFTEFMGSPYPTEKVREIIQKANADNIQKAKLAANNFAPEIDKILDKYLVDIDLAKGHIKKRLGNALERTLGQAPQVTPPSAPQKGAYPVEPQRTFVTPNAQAAPPPIAPIVEPPLPAPPNLQAMPAPFTPQPPPVLNQPQGIERAGDLLENLSIGNLLKGSTKVGSLRDLANNPLAKLALLKGVLGKAALPVEATALGGAYLLKGLTAPTTVGAFVRQAVVNQGSRGLYRGFDAYARGHYKTYRNGVIQSPEERFKAAFDVENDPQLNIEEKAMLQKKINRGEPLI